MGVFATMRVTALLLFMADAGVAWACRCPVPYKKRFKVDAQAASIIVYGQVVETDGLGRWARIKLVEIYKADGGFPDTIQVGRTDVFTDCAYEFTTGTFVLIYSTSEGPVIEVSTCSSTISDVTPKARKLLDRQRRKLGKMFQATG